MKDLVQIIRDNPECVVYVDNDCWWLYRSMEAIENDEEALVCDGEVVPLGSGYGSGCQHGGDVLQALARIVGITIESV